MSEKYIRLKEKELVFLLSKLKNKEVLDRLIILFSNRNKSISNRDNHAFLFICSDNEIETVLDELTFLLTSEGIDECGEVNDVGRGIEEIIDLFTNP